MLGICYQPPDQDDKADDTLLRLLKEVLGQQNLVLMGNFNDPGICWEKNHSGAQIVHQVPEMH